MASLTFRWQRRDSGIRPKFNSLGKTCAARMMMVADLQIYYHYMLGVVTTAQYVHSLFMWLACPSCSLGPSSASPELSGNLRWERRC